MKNLSLLIILLSLIITNKSYSQESENYAIYFDNDKIELKDTVAFHGEKETIGVLLHADIVEGKNVKGLLLRSKPIKMQKLKKVYAHNRTYIAIPSSKMKTSHLCNVLAFNKNSILVSTNYGNILNVWVIDRESFEWGYRVTLFNKNKENKSDYNLKKFKKAIGDSFKDCPDLVKKIEKNIKTGKSPYVGVDYYNCNNSTDLIESLQDEYEILSKNKVAQR